MTFDIGVVAFIGVVLLGLALAWGLTQNRRRNRRLDPVTDQATQALYNEPSSTHEGRPQA